jgi:hypothetical protein
MELLDAAREHVEQYDRHRHGTEFPQVDDELRHERFINAERERHAIEREQRRMERLENKVARKEARRQRRAAWLEQVMRLAASSHDIPREDYLALMEQVASSFILASRSTSERDPRSGSSAPPSRSRSRATTGDSRAHSDYEDGDEHLVTRHPLTQTTGEQPRDPHALPQPHGVGRQHHRDPHHRDGDDVEADNSGSRLLNNVPPLSLAHWRTQLAQHAAARGVTSQPATGRGPAGFGAAAPPLSSRSTRPSVRSASNKVREPATRYPPDLEPTQPLTFLRDRRTRSRSAAQRRSQSARSGEGNDADGVLAPWRPPAASYVERTDIRACQLTTRGRDAEARPVTSKVTSTVPTRPRL